ncbi:unnamed protein product, partial [marine sediment metagenome]
MHAPEESYPIPTKYVADVVIGFIHKLEEISQRIIQVINEVLVVETAREMEKEGGVGLLK